MEVQYIYSMTVNYAITPTQIGRVLPMLTPLIAGNLASNLENIMCSLPSPLHFSTGVEH